MVPLCRHIMPSNQRCKSPAVGGQLYCYHHKVVKIATRWPPRKKYDFTYIIPFHFAEDRAAIQLNVHLINQGLMEGRIDVRTANAYTNNQRIALSNLRLGPLAETDSNNAIRRVILTPEGDEIAPPHEKLEKDESPIHYQDCPCQSCAEQFRGAPPEQHHADCKCGLCEPTINELSSRPKSEQADEAEGPAVSDAADGTLIDQSQPLINECHTERSDRRECSEEPALGFGCHPERSDRRECSEGPAVREARAGNLRTADQLDPIQKIPNYHDYIYGDEIAKHEAQHAARARAALEAGLEPPEHKPWDISTYESPSARAYREWREGIDQRRKESIDKWNAEHPDQPKEFKPYLTWGEEQDLKLAEMKRLREQEETRARGEDAPIISRPPESVAGNQRLEASS